MTADAPRPYEENDARPLEAEPQLTTELEYKIDLPVTDKPEEVIAAIDQLLSAGEDVRLLKTSDKTRQFTYFDTPTQVIRTQGWTLRGVGGFNPEAGDGKNRLRYDYKIGEVGTPSRKEGSFWTDHKLTEDELVGTFQLKDSLAGGRLGKIATADTRHLKRTYQIGESVIELTLDHFVLETGQAFQELEIELEHGDVADLDHLKARLRTIFPDSTYPEVHEQKYDRVMKLVDENKKSSPEGLGGS